MMDAVWYDMTWCGIMSQGCGCVLIDMCVVQVAMGQSPGAWHGGDANRRGDPYGGCCRYGKVRGDCVTGAGYPGASSEHAGDMM